MNTAPYRPFETATMPKNCKVLLRVVALAFAVVATIAVASEPLRAQTQADSNSAQNQAGLQGVLQAIAHGGKVSPRASLPLQVGFFSGRPALYITPEVGADPNAGLIPGTNVSFAGLAQFLANGFNANYIPQNFANLTKAPDNSAVADQIFVFPAGGSPAGFDGQFIQPNVLNSAPHPAGPTNADTNYSPLWQINLVYFNQGVTPYVLKSAQDIADAQNRGDIGAPIPIPVIVECSVIFTPGGGLLPGAKISGDGDRGRDGSGR
jgi:hypothetical protein